MTSGPNLTTPSPAYGIKGNARWIQIQEKNNHSFTELEIFAVIHVVHYVKLFKQTS